MKLFNVDTGQIVDLQADRRRFLYIVQPYRATRVALDAGKRHASMADHPARKVSATADDALSSSPPS